MGEVRELFPSPSKDGRTAAMRLSARSKRMRALAEPYIDEAFRALLVDETDPGVRYRMIIRQAVAMLAASTTPEEAQRYVEGFGAFLRTELDELPEGIA